MHFNISNTISMSILNCRLPAEARLGGCDASEAWQRLLVLHVPCYIGERTMVTHCDCVEDSRLTCALLQVKVFATPSKYSLGGLNLERVGELPAGRSLQVGGARGLG